MDDTVALAECAVPLWVATLDVNEVRPASRAWLWAFQQECVAVLAAHGLTLAQPGPQVHRVLYEHVKTRWPGGVKGLVEGLLGRPLVLGVAPGHGVVFQ